MNKLAFLLLAALFISGAASCKQPPPDPTTITNLNVKQGKELIDENKNNPDFVILDVRTPEEFNSGHIANAVNIDYKSPDFKEQLENLDKDKTYALYCHSGRRATASADIMNGLGFQNIYNFGGVKQWLDAGYTLTPPENE